MKIKITKYKKNILKLFSGTSVAQLIPLISAPILTRIYSPEDFGVFATFLAISAIVSIVATFRLELAIVIPENKKDGESLLLLVLINSIIFSFLALLLTLLIMKYDQDLQLGKYIYLIAFSVLVHSWYKGFYYLTLRNKRFNLLASNRILIAIIILVLSLLIPLLIKGPFGLIISNIIAYAVGVVIFFIFNSKTYIKRSFESLIKILREYKNYPIFDMPSAFMIQLSNRLPIVLLSNYFPIKLIGHYSLTQRMLDMPISFVTTAVSDTFKQKAAEDFNTKGNCIEVFYETRNLLFFLSIIPFVVIQFFSPHIFKFVFGAEWTIAGEYAQILAIMFLMRFVTGPLSYMFYINNKMKLNMYGQILKISLSTISLVIGIVFNDIKLGLLMYSISNSTVYLIYYFYSLNFARGNPKI